MFFKSAELLVVEQLITASANGAVSIISMLY